MQTLTVSQVASEDASRVHYGATTEVHSAGVVVGRPGSLPTLNWCFLIIAANSIPLIVSLARVYEYKARLPNAVRDFVLFTGIQRPEEFGALTARMQSPGATLLTF